MKIHWKYFKYWNDMLTACFALTTKEPCFCRSQIFTRAISPTTLLKTSLVLLEVRTFNLFVISLCTCTCTYRHKTRLYSADISLQPHSLLPLPENLADREERRPLLDLFHCSWKAALLHHRLQDGQNLASRWPESLIVLLKWDITVGTQIIES